MLQGKGSPMSQYTPRTLRKLRLDQGISLQKAAGYFDIADAGSIRKWENNQSPPRQTRRRKFLGYLWDTLRLSQQPEMLKQLWDDVMVMTWGWDPLTVDELEQYKRLGATDLLYPAGQDAVHALTAEQHAVVRLFLLSYDEASIAQQLGLKGRHVQRLLHGQAEKLGSIPYRLNASSIKTIERQYAIRYPEAYQRVRAEKEQASIALPTEAASPALTLPTAHSVGVQSTATLQVVPAGLSAHAWVLQYRQVIRMRLTILFLLVVLFVFIPIYLFDYRHEPFNYFSNIYALIPATIGIYGLRRIHTKQLWGRHRFYVGYAALCLSLLLWTVGALTWTWYNFRYSEDVPYPFWPDLGYGSHQFLFPTVLLLMEASLFEKQRFLRRHLLYACIALALIASWMGYLRGWQLTGTNEPWKFLLDCLYPVTDVVSLRVLWHLSSYRFPPALPRAQVALRVMAVGMAILFVADLCFGATTTLPASHPYAYYVGGMADFLFACGFYGLGCGLISIPTNMHLFLPPSLPMERLRLLSAARE